MRYSVCFVALAALILVTAPVSLRAAEIARDADGHPDLSGIWTYAAALPGSALRVTDEQGKTSVNTLNTAVRYRPASNEIPGVQPWTREPSYKPEFQAEVKNLSENQSKTDPVFYCGKPGVPRIGSPRRIIQLPGEVVFLYEDMSGDMWRVIPTDGRPHREDANPTYYGDSVGRWEGDTLVVESTNFVDDTWIGEEGYIHSDALRVVERFWLHDGALMYQTTSYDPNVLTEPWTQAARRITASDLPLEESPVCIEVDGPRLINKDHHLQR